MQSIAEPQEQLLYTIEEAAHILSMSGSSLRRLIKNGSLKTVRPSIGTVRITRAELEAFASEGRGASYQTPPDCSPNGEHYES
jgi:excisionase family DNA binding protein